MRTTNKNRLLAQLEAGSIAPIKGRCVLSSFITDSLANSSQISFYTWECMPRKTIIVPGKPVFYDFNVNIDKAVNKSKFVQLENVERKLLLLLDKSRLNYKFYLFTADTNPAVMYPESGLKFSPEQLDRLSSQFQILLQGKADKLFGIGKVEVVRFSQLLNKFQNTYKDAFDRVYEDLKKDIYQNPWASKSQVTKIISRLASHINVPLSQKDELEERARRYLASYAAEGMVLGQLDSSGQIPNPVWVNNEPVTTSTQATELVRRKERLPLIPTVYYLYQTSGDDVFMVEEDQRVIKLKKAL